MTTQSRTRESKQIMVAPQSIRCWCRVYRKKSRRGSTNLSMNELLGLSFLSLAQAQAVYLVVNSSIMEKLRPRLPRILQELTSCPICSGTWLSLGLASLQVGSWRSFLVDTLVISFLGSVLYELKQKLLPCKQCQNPVQASQWK